MAEKRIPTILSGFFNQDSGTSVGGNFTKMNGQTVELPYGVSAKRPMRDFAAELKELTDAEKLELAEGVCVITGDTITA
jgi:hypothetical protein